MRKFLTTVFVGMFLMPISNALADKCYSEYDCECCTQLFSSLYPGSATDISTVRMFMESAAGGYLTMKKAKEC